MILPFSTQLNGKPTFFVEKIWKGIRDNSNEIIEHYEYDWDYKRKQETRLFQWTIFEKLKPKIHTIREDKNNRWKPGVLIDFYINCRQPNMFRFAPRISVISTQDVVMTFGSDGYILLFIDNRQISDHNEKLLFAKNDGFDTWEDFVNYFYPQILEDRDKCIVRKLIHWTDKRY